MAHHLEQDTVIAELMLSSQGQGLWRICKSFLYLFWPVLTSRFQLFKQFILALHEEVSHSFHIIIYGWLVLPPSHWFIPYSSFHIFFGATRLHMGIFAMWMMEQWGNMNNSTQNAQTLLTRLKITTYNCGVQSRGGQGKNSSVLKHQTAVCPAKISSFLGAIINAVSWLQQQSSLPPLYHTLFVVPQSFFLPVPDSRSVSWSLN